MANDKPTWTLVAHANGASKQHVWTTGTQKIVGGEK